MIKIHPTAIVETQDIGQRTSIWAMVHVMKNVVIGSDCNIGDHCFLESGCRVGDRVTIKNMVLLWDGVTIQDDVFIGPRVTFSNDRYPRSPRMPQAKQRYEATENWLERTMVQRGCSIGAGAILCPGIELGAYSMIAAGAVVTAPVSPFSLVRGVPAKHVTDVCVCGHPLPGDWRCCDCPECGRSGYDRQQLLQQANLGLPSIDFRQPVKQHG
jgi:UDP-2-acetamido-3-amino-2,3-dideoxy-glucuronate N-acetyltransferase